MPNPNRVAALLLLPFFLMLTACFMEPIPPRAEDAAATEGQTEVSPTQSTSFPAPVAEAQPPTKEINRAAAPDFPYKTPEECVDAIRVAMFDLDHRKVFAALTPDSIDFILKAHVTQQIRLAQERLARGGHRKDNSELVAKYGLEVPTLEQLQALSEEETRGSLSRDWRKN